MLLCLQISSSASETNQVTNAPAPNSFEAFRIVAQRNIFNPNRSSGGGSRNEDARPSRSARTESFTLVGTMLYANGQYAFFDSSSAGYKKALKTGDTIARYKINEVTPNEVKLEADGKMLSVAVGQQLKRQDEGEWTVSGKAAVEEPKASSSGASSDDEDEAVKRLMKKREAEMNK